MLKLSKIIFISLLIGLSTVSCSINSQNKKKKIGVSLWIENDDFQKNYEGFIEGLKVSGYEENKNLELIVVNPKGDLDKHNEAVELFKKEKVDLIFTRGSSATLAAKQKAPNIPIVFSIVTFPVQVGLIDSINEASNKIAGTSNHVTIDHQYKVFSSILPELHSIAFIRSKTGQPNSLLQFKEFQEFLKEKNIKVLDFAADDLGTIIARLKADPSAYDAIYGACDAIVQSGGEEPLAKLALSLSKPSFSCNKSSIAKGFMAALVADYYELGKEAGFKAAEILKNNKVLSSDLSTPILNLNAKVASRLGITIPEELKRTINVIVYSDGSQEI